jgi:sigma-B regulation protein RsbU (phosphoserine phosphatase)
MFGKNRLKDLIRSHHGLSAESIVETVIEAVRRFQSGHRQLDDVTLVAIKFLEMN